MMNRRTVLAGFAGLAVSACSGPDLTVPSGPGRPEFLPKPNPAYDAWVEGFRQRARSRGISGDTLVRGFRGAGFLPGVIDRDRNQTEFTRTLEDYIAIAASDERVASGRAAISRQRSKLDAIERRYGVAPHVVGAIWGLESRYGQRRGDIPVISALSTLAFDGRRGSFFENQLIAALKILQNGDVPASRMTGSWAGAMGHTQFIPTSYLAYAVDFNGDGRRDIWSNDPGDALASAASYLKRSGWVSGQPWGMEVRLPDGFSTGTAGRGNTKSVAAWTALGVRDPDGGRVADHGTSWILPPEGGPGPAFMMFRNATVISRYNRSVKYVIGVGHLSDRLNGGGPLRATFGPDDQGMTLADRKALQGRLTARGFDTGGTDGVIGPKTENAIRAYQRGAGLAQTGEPSLALLRDLG